MEAPSATLQHSQQYRDSLSFPHFFGENPKGGFRIFFCTSIFWLWQRRRYISHQYVKKDKGWHGSKHCRSIHGFPTLLEFIDDICLQIGQNFCSNTDISTKLVWFIHKHNNENHDGVQTETEDRPWRKPQLQPWRAVHALVWHLELEAPTLLVRS